MVLQGVQSSDLCRVFVNDITSEIVGGYDVEMFFFQFVLAE